MAACHGAALVSLITFLPIYLRAVRGASPAETGFILLPLTCGHRHRLDDHRADRDQNRLHRGISHLRIDRRRRWAWCSSPSGRRILRPPSCPGSSASSRFFMGTVMGVVQVTVQAVSGPRLLGTGAAMVQFSRSVGAAFGTALVAAVLFAILAGTDRETASMLGAIMEQGPQAIATLTPARQAIVQAEIADAFRSAFLTIGRRSPAMPQRRLLAWTLPLRRAR